jgi:Tfp pilus assembly protein PilZ
MQELGARFLEYARLDRKRTDQGLTVQELERWSELKRSLTLHLSPGLDPDEVDRRRSVRVPTCLRVSYHSIVTELTNFSRSGAFVQTSSPLQVGSQVRLRIQLAENGTELEIPGRVATVQVGPSFDSSQIGMGVQFSEMAPETAKQLSDLYEQLIRRELAPDQTGDAGSDE